MRDLAALGDRLDLKRWTVWREGGRNPFFNPKIDYWFNDLYAYIVSLHYYYRELFTVRLDGNGGMKNLIHKWAWGHFQRSQSSHARAGWQNWSVCLSALA